MMSTDLPNDTRAYQYYPEFFPFCANHVHAIMRFQSSPNTKAIWCRRTKLSWTDAKETFCLQLIVCETVDIPKYLNGISKHVMVR